MQRFNPFPYNGPHGPGDPEGVVLVNELRARYAAPVALYADGGVIGANPSPIGGTWAWCMADANGNRIKQESGIIRPDVCDGPVTNNITELVALVYGLEALPTLWNGTVYSDSQVSLLRVFCAGKLNNVPEWLKHRLWAIQKTGRLQHMSWKLLDGHPTKAQLEAGVGKRGNLVSVHNVWCDSECQRLAKEARNGR